MKKAALVVGARPQFIKTAPLILEVARFFQVVLIHTGQHYDFMMSDNFFDELAIPKPDYHLDINGSSPGRQIGRMIEGLESTLSYEKPHLAIVVGDTNSTLAGAVSAAKLGIQLVHVEAGVRSKDKHLPEQINRVVTDSISDCLLCPTPTAVTSLKCEGKTDGVHDCGDVIYDCLRMFETRIPARPASIPNLPSQFALATIHRAEAVDSKERLERILCSLGTAPFPVVLPVHPRTRKMLESFGLFPRIPSNLMLTDPVGYADILSLIRLSEFVVTDSGGIQREAIFLGKPVYVARPETEWRELEESKWLKVVGYEFDLSHGFKPPSRVNEKLRLLMRPASRMMAEVMSNL